MHTLWRHPCVSTGIRFYRYNSCPYGHHCPGLLIPSVIYRSEMWQRQPLEKCLGNSNRRHRCKVLILTSKSVEVVTPSQGGCGLTGLRHTEGAPWCERCLQCPTWNSSPVSKRHFKINEAKINSWSAFFSTSKRRRTNYSNHGLPHFHKWHPYPLSSSGPKSNPWVHSFSSSTNPQKGPAHSPKTHPDSALLFSPSVFQPSRAAMIAGLDFCQEPSSWFPCCLTCPF